MAIVLFALLSLEYIGTALLCGLLLLSLFIPQVDVDTIGQMILALFSLFAAYIIVMVFGTGSIDNPPGELGAIETTTALWILLVSVPGRRCYSLAVGTAGNAGIILLAVLSMGNVRHGHRYPVSALAVLVFTAAGHAHGGPRPTAMAGGVAQPATFLGLGFSRNPPYFRNLDGRTPYALSLWVPADDAPDINSSHRLQQNLHLGSLRDVLHSTDVVLRIRGPKPDYLRDLSSAII